MIVIKKREFLKKRKQLNDIYQDQDFCPSDPEDSRVLRTSFSLESIELPEWIVEEIINSSFNNRKI